MKKTLLALLMLLIFVSCKNEKTEKGRILFIVSNTENMGDPEKHFAGNNLWEVAPPYHIFVSHGYEVDFVSPTGGKVPFSMDPLGISSYTIKYEKKLELYLYIHNITEEFKYNVTNSNFTSGRFIHSQSFADTTNQILHINSINVFNWAAYPQQYEFWTEHSASLLQFNP